MKLLLTELFLVDQVFERSSLVIMTNPSLMLLQRLVLQTPQLLQMRKQALRQLVQQLQMPQLLKLLMLQKQLLLN